MRAEQGPSVNPSSLTPRDIDRLNTWKWRYSLESHGFTTKQAEHLLFMRWGAHHGAIGQEDTSATVNAETIDEVEVRLEGELDEGLQRKEKDYQAFQKIAKSPPSSVPAQTPKPTEHVIIGGDLEKGEKAPKPTQEQIDAFEQWLKEHGRAA